MIEAPNEHLFPAAPKSWYLVGPSRQFTRRPRARMLAGKRLVLYRTGDGRPVALDSRCCHLGADLANGDVVGNAIRCPFHEWEFGPDGRCVRIPAQKEIPPQARQPSYPIVERHGFVYLFLGERPLFPLPFFAGCDPADFTPAPPFRNIVDCPWYMIGANGFDVQHFQAAHDRVLLEQSAADCPAPFARRIVNTSAVAGNSMQDRLVRLLSGEKVTMTVTDWCGNVSLVTARFRRTCSYGMVTTEPLAPDKVLVTIVVFVPKSPTALGRALVDPIHARIRRKFIQAFIRGDAVRLQGTRYAPRNLIPCDRSMADYFAWLARTSNGVPGVAADCETASSRSELVDVPSGGS